MVLFLVINIDDILCFGNLYCNLVINWFYYIRLLLFFFLKCNIFGCSEDVGNE